MKDFINWLFNEPNGHFAIATALLVLSVAGWIILVFVKPEAAAPAAAAVLTLWQLFLTKLKGS